MSIPYSERTSYADVVAAPYSPITGQATTPRFDTLSLSQQDAPRGHYVRTTTLVYRVAPYPFDMEPMFSVALYRQVSSQGSGGDSGSGYQRCEEEERSNLSSSVIDGWMPSPGDGLIGRLYHGVRTMKYEYAVQHRQRIFDECFGRQVTEHTHESARVLASAKAELLTLGRRRVVMIFLTNGALYFTTEWHFSTTQPSAAGATTATSAAAGMDSVSTQRVSREVYQCKHDGSSINSSNSNSNGNIIGGENHPSKATTSMRAALQSIFGRNALHSAHDVVSSTPGRGQNAPSAVFGGVYSSTGCHASSAEPGSTQRHCPAEVREGYAAAETDTQEEESVNTEHEIGKDGYRCVGSSRSEHVRERVSLCSMASILPSVTFEVHKRARVSDSGATRAGCSTAGGTGETQKSAEGVMDTLYIQGVPSVVVLPTATQVFTAQPRQIFQLAHLSDVLLTVPKSSVSGANRASSSSNEPPVVTLFSASALFGEVLTPSEYRLARSMPCKLDGLVFNTVLIRAWHTRLQERGLPLLNPLVQYAKRH